ncbi:MAG: hypothetical protein KDB80_04700, partial [Planctomycetes bacterium]|nr:hypothetical protein [Planctomycetota bacterium]
TSTPAPSSTMPKPKAKQGRRLADTPPARPKPAAAPSRAPAPASGIYPRVEIEEVSTNSQPASRQGLPADIANIAGACVVSGEARERAGAAARGSSIHRRR